MCDNATPDTQLVRIIAVIQDGFNMLLKGFIPFGKEQNFRLGEEGWS